MSILAGETIFSREAVNLRRWEDFRSCGGEASRRSSTTRKMAMVQFGGKFWGDERLFFVSAVQ